MARARRANCLAKTSVKPILRPGCASINGKTGTIQTVGTATPPYTATPKSAGIRSLDWSFRGIGWRHSLPWSMPTSFPHFFPLGLVGFFDRAAIEADLVFAVHAILLENQCIDGAGAADEAVSQFEWFVIALRDEQIVQFVGVDLHEL